MIIGEATAEKLIISDYVQPVYNPADMKQPPVVGFLDGDGKMMFAIPCDSPNQAAELSDKFQLIFLEAMKKAGINPRSEKKIVDDFHRLFYMKAFMDGNKAEAQTQAMYKGMQIQKNGLDLQIYHEILWDTKPTLIIECGSASGASAIWMADQMDAIGEPCAIISIDISTDEQMPKHRRVTFLSGSTLDEKIYADVATASYSFDRVMVVLDDDHHMAHVAKELELYPQLVTPGCYLIVEDTNVNGEPVMHGYGQGPQEAVKAFLQSTDLFVVDRTREKFFMTWNPGGYLKRLR